MIDKNFYKENGYLIIKNLFYKQDLKRLLDECYDVLYHQIDRLTLIDKNGKLLSRDEGAFRLFEKDPEVLKACGKVMQWLPTLHRMGVDKTLFYYLTELGLSKPTISTRPVLFFHHKQLAEDEINYKVPPHRDSYSVRGSKNAAVCWFPLVPITKEMGPLHVIPKSHLKPHNLERIYKSFGLEAGTKDSDFIPVIIEPGDAIIFHMDLIHKSGDNISDNIRWSASTRYSDLYDQDWIERSYFSPYKYSVEY